MVSKLAKLDSLILVPPTAENWSGWLSHAGSSFYNETANVLYNCEVKHSTFTTGGHAKNTTNTLIVNNRGCDSGQGYYERFDNNTCCMFATSGSWLNIPTMASCNPAQPIDLSEKPVPTPERQGNTYYLANTSAWRYKCGGAEWTLAEAQAKGMELGTVLKPLPTGGAQLAEVIMRLARPLLGLVETDGRKTASATTSIRTKDGNAIIDAI